MKRIALVGAGYIARVHADALKSLQGFTIAAVIDPNEAAARRLARACGAAAVFPSVEAALAAGGIDAAHVLVPPPLHHVVAEPLIAAGIPVLLEKPLATTAADAQRLVERAAACGVALGVNQNFVHHPAFVRLRQALAAGAIGRPRFLSCLYHVPLRQLAAGQFGHWMFQAPGNILLEQAVHPLSQIATLAGPIGEVRALAGAGLELAPGVDFFPTLEVSLAGARLPAQLHFAVGQSYPVWRISVVGDDGVLTADILTNRYTREGRTRWLDALDHALSGTHLAAETARDSLGNLAAYGLAMLRLRPPSDPFFLSMQGSIAAFHAALASGVQPPLDGAFGAALVATCERIAAVFPPASQAPALEPAGDGGADVAVLGGTGFIGRHLVARLVADGKRVAVMARSIRNLPAIFHDPAVSLHRGDINDAAAVAEAIGAAPVVVNLAHGGGGGSFAEIRQAMVGGAETVAAVCRAHGVRRLIHIGSIAGLYLGPQAAPVTGATPPDPKAEKRADYARAKAICDRALLAENGRQGLEIVILRPGLVVGAGTSPFHSGLGVYNNEQHCLGWNDGRNPLPFVLAGDVAAAIASACAAPGIGGRAFNLVGDVRLSARDYTEALAAALGRPLRFHPQSPLRLLLIERGKWLIKRLGGRKAAAPSFHDLLSRGLRARFDCTDAKEALGWQPVADRATFLAEAFGAAAR